MPFVQQFKDAAHGFVSCCDRQRTGSKLGPYSDDSYQHAAVSKRGLGWLKSWPISTRTGSTQQKARWKADHEAELERKRQREEKRRKERISKIEPIDKETAEGIFIYDIILFGIDREKFAYRRLKLDFQVQFDAVSDEIPQLVNIPITSYAGGEVKLPTGHWVKPLGTIEVKWQLYKGQHQYKTEFLVIENSPYDMLLGRPSIHNCRLWEEDNDILERLQCP
ncbi:retropepsin-like aspartic protease [Aspergillus foveolatus]|uniref:retropepsin-like aspartic protease n=1 Tax=Aspergillus foveolatus TaxID=210207 RepID=UPI003CCCF93A